MIIEFNPIRLIRETIREFLNDEYASSVVKTAISIELLLKNELKIICPTLILERLDDEGLQVAKVHGLQRQLKNPKKLEDMSLRTASLPVLLKRAESFFDITSVKRHLLRLHDLRSAVVHYKGEVDDLELNILLSKYAIPFALQIIKKHKSAPSWIPAYEKRLKGIAEKSTDKQFSQLLKTLAKFHSRLDELPEKEIARLKDSKCHADSMETEIQSGLVCPACRYESLSALIAADLDWSPDGVIEHTQNFVRCKICGLELGEDELRLAAKRLDDIGETTRREWINAITYELPDRGEPDYDDI